MVHIDDSLPKVDKLVKITEKIEQYDKKIDDLEFFLEIMSKGRTKLQTKFDSLN